MGGLDSKYCAETMAGDYSREGLLQVSISFQRLKIISKGSFSSSSENLQVLNTPWDATSGRLGNGTCSGRGTCLLTRSQVPFFSRGMTGMTW